MGRIIRFAVATAMRQEEICRIEHSDFDPNEKMLLVRDRKDPRRKNGNHQRIPLLSVTGYDACVLIEEQCAFLDRRKGRIFPYNRRPVGTAFRRQCRELGIQDLHFHDLRHEGTSRLFEAETLLRDAIARDSNNASLRNARGVMFAAMKRHLDAVWCYQDALAWDSAAAGV